MKENKTIMSSKFKWRDAEHFFSCDMGDIVEKSHSMDDEDDSFRVSAKSMTRRIDGDDYEVTTRRDWGVEGESYTEDWTLNDKFHRMGGKPARLSVDEGPQAEDNQGNNRVQTMTFCVHGQTLKTRREVSRMGEPVAEPEEEALAP
jgi:hypothetical protein